MRLYVYGHDPDVLWDLSDLMDLPASMNVTSMDLVIAPIQQQPWSLPVTAMVVAPIETIKELPLFKQGFV